MLRYISAGIIIPVNEPYLRKGIITIDEKGVVQEICQREDFTGSLSAVEEYEGVIIPGFVNAHCHLELSHMLDKIPQKTGLPTFLTQVMTSRGAEPKEVLAKSVEADKQMYANGIQAVGDHVNTEITAQIKENSPISYHTFVEIMGTREEEIQGRIDRARDTEFFFDPQHSSITPHAPYSCSKVLFKAFKKAVNEDNIISIHNQESEEENKLFRYREGEFVDFYKNLGLNLEAFKAQARNSLQSYLPYLPTRNKLLLIHNTYTSLKDLDFVTRMNRDVYFCICAKANLYIEDHLPKILNFIPDQERMVVGTDSLASNNTLDILAELKVIHQANPQLDFLQLIKWATINGAHALNLADTLGSISVGKRPGLVLLKGMDNLRLNEQVTLERIA